MKKLLTIGLLAVALMLSGTPAFAFSFSSSYTGPVTIYINGYSEHGFGDDTQTWTVFQVSSITGGSTTLWYQGKDGEYLNGILYGLYDNNITGTPPNVNIYQTGGTYSIYLSNNPMNAGTGEGELGPDQRSGNTFPTITSPNVFLAGNLVPGIIDGDGVTTLYQEASSATVPASGSGRAYGEVLSGLYAAIFNSNGFVNGSDVKIEFSFEETDPNTYPTSWDAQLYSGSVIARAIPEPTSMLLFGTGLFGLIGAGLRRKA